jgi:hypothetical protein
MEMILKIINLKIQARDFKWILVNGKDYNELDEIEALYCSVSVYT